MASRYIVFYRNEKIGEATTYDRAVGLANEHRRKYKTIGQPGVPNGKQIDWKHNKIYRIVKV